MAGVGTGYFGDLASIFGGTGTADQYGGAISGTAGIAGMAISAMGIFGGMSAAKEEANISMQEAGTEMQMNAVRQSMMQLDANRKMIEANRNADLMRARSRAASTNQGAQFGSGAKSGQQQVTAEEAWNVGKLGEDVFMGNQMFTLTNQLDQEKIAMARAQSDAATAQGKQALGQAIVGGAAMFGKLSMGGL